MLLILELLVVELFVELMVGLLHLKQLMVQNFVQLQAFVQLELMNHLGLIEQLVRTMYLVLVFQLLVVVLIISMIVWKLVNFLRLERLEMF